MRVEYVPVIGADGGHTSDDPLRSPVLSGVRPPLSSGPGVDGLMLGECVVAVTLRGMKLRYILIDPADEEKNSATSHLGSKPSAIVSFPRQFPGDAQVQEKFWRI